MCIIKYNFLAASFLTTSHSLFSYWKPVHFVILCQSIAHDLKCSLSARDYYVVKKQWMV